MMGKLILCSGCRTNRPYTFTSVGIRVYSIEELCYFLYNHVYLIEEGMFCDPLFDFIDTELKLTERANKLRLLKKQNADIKTMVTIILCSADIYTENEIKSMLKTLDEVIGMPMIRRNWIKADSYLKNHQLKEAADEYELIINSKEAIELTPEEYGDLFHNLAVAKVRTTGLKEATKLLGEAVERNHREESLRQYLYTLLLSGNEEEYLKKIEEYGMDAEFDQSVRKVIEEQEEEAKSSELMIKIQQLKDYKADGRITEYHNRINEILNSWKAKVRQF